MKSYLDFVQTVEMRRTKHIGLTKAVQSGIEFVRSIVRFQHRSNVGEQAAILTPCKTVQFMPK